MPEAQSYPPGSAWDPASTDASAAEPARRTGVWLLVGLAAVALVIGGAGVGAWIAAGSGQDVSAQDNPPSAQVVEDADSDEPSDAEVAEDADDASGGSSAAPRRESEGEDGLPADADAQPGDEILSDPPVGDRDPERFVRVDFDGVCFVDMLEEEIYAGDPRPWQFPQFCPSAPVDLTGVSERWIIVVASLNGDDFDYLGALERANREGLPGRVLWSTHYPSLNPHLWVVYDGPFADESGAASAARARGDASYPRVLSDDSADRYCVAADGCLGERDRS